MSNIFYVILYSYYGCTYHHNINIWITIIICFLNISIFDMPYVFWNETVFVFLFCFLSPVKYAFRWFWSFIKKKKIFRGIITSLKWHTILILGYSTSQFNHIDGFIFQKKKKNVETNICMQYVNKIKIK